MSVKFTKIEGDALLDHAHLNNNDECYFLLEYTSGKNFSFSKANQIISNLKKKPSFKTRPDVWKHKTRVIDAAGATLGQLLNKAWLQDATLVPIPPSKTRADPEYDDRMLQILKKIDVGFPLDIRELVIQNSSLRASHEAGDGNRVTIEELLATYQIQENIASPTPKAIGIFDDVLTAGAHFRAMTQTLSARFPNVPIAGFFVARRIFPPPDDQI